MASVVGAYARAFADVVVGNKLDSDRLHQELHTVEGLFAESDPLRRVLENPSIPGDRKLAVLDAIVQRAGLGRQVRNFIAVLVDHRRVPLYSDIVKQVEQKLLEAEVARLTGKKVRARYQQDASLLGGAVVRVGSTIYDGSVKGQLEKIREQLIST